jgi:2,3-bisphosphoglycerate-independent phosphoglycerate mutase
MSRVLLVFLDGVGIGEKDPSQNPFFARSFKFINEIFGNTPHLENQKLQRNDLYLFPVDPLMGVNGIPQSGTGQTSILCGVNAQKIIGQHFGPFPYSDLIPVIREKNLFKELISEGRKVCFANAYPQRFFDYLNSGKRRIGVFARSIFESNMTFNTIDDVKEGRALTGEITNMVWRTRLGYDINVISPISAADNLIKISSQHDFTLYEFFLTDHLGHGRIKDQFELVCNTLDEFLFRLLTEIPSDTTLLICSDHGNFENLSIKQHTLNPTLAITAGNEAKKLSTHIKDLSNIKSAINIILS